MSISQHLLYEATRLGSANKLAHKHSAMFESDVLHMDAFKSYSSAMDCVRQLRDIVIMHFRNVFKMSSDERLQLAELVGEVCDQIEQADDLLSKYQTYEEDFWLTEDTSRKIQYLVRAMAIAEHYLEKCKKFSGTSHYEHVFEQYKLCMPDIEMCRDIACSHYSTVSKMELSKKPILVLLDKIRRAEQMIVQYEAGGQYGQYWQPVKGLITLWKYIEVKKQSLSAIESICAANRTIYSICKDRNSECAEEADRKIKYFCKEFDVQNAIIRQLQSLYYEAKHQIFPSAQLCSDVAEKIGSICVPISHLGDMQRELAKLEALITRLS